MKFRAVTPYIIAVLLFSLSGALGCALYLSFHPVDRSRWICPDHHKLPSRRAIIYLQIDHQDTQRGKFYLHFFYPLAYFRPESDDLRAKSFSARVFIPQGTWAEVFWNCREDGRSYESFRFSRAKAVPSAFRVIKNRSAIQVVPVVIPGVDFSSSVTAQDRIWLYGKMLKYAGCFGILKRVFNGKWYTLEVSFGGDAVTAFVNGRRVGVFTRSKPHSGYVGVRSGDFPPIFIDAMGVQFIHQDGSLLTIEDDFSNPRATLGMYAKFCGATTLAGLILWLILLWLLHFYSYKESMPVLRIRLLIPFVSFIIVPALYFSLHWITGQRDLYTSYHRASALFGFLLFIILAISRRHFQFYLGAKDTPLPPIALPSKHFPFCYRSAGEFFRKSWRVLLVVSSGFVILSLLIYRTYLKPEPLDPVRAYAAKEVRSASRGTHIPFPASPSGGRLTLRLSLDENSEMEVYFYRGNPRLSAEPTWYALRLSTKPANSGFVKSEGFWSLKGSPGLQPKREYHLELEFRRQHFRALLDGKPFATASDGEYKGGMAGLVIRDGNATLSNIVFSTFSPRAQSGTSGFKFLVGGVVLLLWIVITLLLWWVVGSAAISGVLRLSLPAVMRFRGGVLLLQIAVFAIWYVVSQQIQFPRGSSIYVFFWVLFAGWVIGYLFLVVNFERAHLPNLSSILYLTLLALSAEALLRTNPKVNVWRFPRPGYWMGGLVNVNLMPQWDNYLRQPSFRDRKCPIRKPRNAFRVFCLGGSSTYGSGVNEPRQAYPHFLEIYLKKRCPSKEIEVYNTGLEGFTVVDDYVLLTNHLLNRKPDAVTLYMGGNEHIYPWWLEMGPAELVKVQERSPLSAKRLGDILLRIRLFNWLRVRIRLLKTILNVRPPVNVSLKDYGLYLKRFAKLSRESHFHLVFIPELFVEDLKGEPTTMHLYQKVMEEVGKEEGIPVLKPQEEFREFFEDDVFTDTIHLNEEGNRRLGEFLARRLADLWCETHPTP